MNDPQQTQRIREKLSRAKASDPQLEVFGAKDHGYRVNPPASAEAISDFEKQHAVRLPEAYRRFLLEVGNGGIGYAGSAAGPFYGIYVLGTPVGDIPCDHPEEALRKPCVLSPSMSESAWAALTSNLRGDAALDGEAYEDAASTLFGGLLPIGSQGCSYLHCLVINGPHAGRVVNLDTECSRPPFFAFEPDFLAWYERWLDEVIEGELKQAASWFGYVRGGSQAQLISGWRGSDDAQTAREFLKGLLFKRRLSESTLDELVQLLPDAREPRAMICKIVSKSNPAKARPLLVEAVGQDSLTFLQCLHWYLRARVLDWQAEILSLADRITDAETLRFFIYALEALPVDRAVYLLPFTGDKTAEMRISAFHALGEIEDRSRFLDCFIEGLGDPDHNVVRTTLQALRGVKDRSLLPHYRALAERFPEKQDHVLSNLDQRLAEFGTTRSALLRTEEAPWPGGSPRVGFLERAVSRVRRRAIQS